MRKKLVPLVLLLAILAPLIASANHPTPLPDTITTPSFNYNVRFTNDNPPPATDGNFFPSAQAQNIANALNNNNPSTAGNPNGYHNGYTDLGFRAPDFGGTNRDVNVFDCSMHGGCDSGNAPADRIQMPSTTYSGSSESCLRTVIGHELFHHVQYAYITFGKWTQWGGVPVEGTARLMQDKIFGDLDGNAGCITYNGEVGNYMANPNQTLWNISYTSAIFWNYLMEQLGTDTTEPHRGVDFIRRFWENAAANNDSPDLIGTIRQTIGQLNTGVTLEGLFHDFSIANYAKDFDVTGLADGLKYRYVDEHDTTAATYPAVTTRWSGSVPPAQGPVADSVVRWGTQYYQADLSPNCLGGVAGFKSDGDTAAYSLMALQGNKVDRLYKSVTGNFARAVIMRRAVPYTRLTAVVAGLDNAANFTYTFDCGPAKLQIVEPDSTKRAYVGEPGAPDRFLVRLSVTGPASLGTPSVQGLDPSDFQVYVGEPSTANQATVISGAYVQGQYWLVAQAPTKPTNGTYPLFVRLGDLANDVKEAAVVYQKQILDQHLVIDRSGSMLLPTGSPKLDAAKNAAALFVDSARSQDKLGVVSFGGDNVEPNDDSTLLWFLQSVSDANRAAARSLIAGITTNPSVLTSIGDGIKRATDDLNFRGDPPPAEKWIVLMSDGMENEALRWNDVKASVQAAGIKVNTIALGPLTDQPLLQSIANDTGGIYYYVDVNPAAAAAPHAVAPLAASSALPNQLGDAYAVAAEKMQRHERIWEDAGSVGGTPKTIDIPVKEGGISDGLFSFNWSRASDNLGVTIRRPNGTTVVDGVAGARIRRDSTHVTVLVGDLQPGTWQVTLSAAAGAPEYIGILSGKDQQGAQLDLQFAQYNPDFYLREIQHGLFMRGMPMPIVTTLTDRKGPVRNAKVVAQVAHPDGRIDRLPLFDDGSHSDGNAGDGVYGNLYTRTTVASLTGQPDAPTSSQRGSYNVQVDASGKDNLGGTFTRIKKGAFQVFEGAPRDQKDPDPDKDGMPTRYEQLHPCLDGNVNDAAKDGDGDGVENRKEFELGTDPCSADTDRGGESDASELARGADAFDPSDDALPRPIDVEVVNWALDHLPKPDIRPNANLIRYPVNRSYAKVRILRSTNPTGPFSQVAEFGAKDFDGLYRDNGLTNFTTYYYQAQGVDLNGHASAPSHIFSGTPKPDVLAPIGHVTIFDHHRFIDRLTVLLKLDTDEDATATGSAQAAQATGTEMLVSNNGTFAGAQWQPFVPDVQWQLAPDPKTGLAEVFVKYRDAAGNESQVYHDEITVVPQGRLGAIHGKVTINGKPGAGVFVSVPGKPDVVPAFTDADGNFILIGLLKGTYDLTFTRDGVGSARVTGIAVAGTDVGIGPVDIRQIKVFVPLVAR